MPALIDISHLDFAYPGQGPAAVLALKHLDLQIETGSTVGLIGPNGGGKTTLLKLLLGLLSPTRGRILIDGLPPIQAVRQGNILGYLPQNRLTENPRFPLNVRQLARLGLAGKTGVLRAYDKADLQFVDSLLNRLGLTELAEAPIGDLSGGQLQRALIARALAPRPKVLLLDEPTTGIDRAGQQQFIELLQGLKREFGLTVVIVSHDLRAVTAISDRIACLNFTLHYHDVPERIPAELVYRMFSCDLQAMGIGSPHCGCDDAGCGLEHPMAT